ncbi:DJ-1/PfpI family protein [Nocardia cerradoensis]|uniref:DJ-1/PfpI family protein n=2 Tax=Nocardia cerradoensis TaxID=85688 RepID=UPI00058446D5|nr:DJ-1/PfpI family protein [Nocardia cerradoensis]NKY43290.1 DJ-1/PfpI family protein [Nocardia cerradoensis]
MFTGRRDFLMGATAALAGMPWLRGRAVSPRDTSAPIRPVDEPLREGSEQIAMLLYPQCTALDFIGPQYAFACLSGATVHQVAATMEPIVTDTGVTLTPTATFDQCPRDVDVLFVPGGTNGTLAAMRDDNVIRFVADRGARATWVTSVCTGSLVLGAAGLLRGYRATSHWAARDLLAEAHAIPTDSRVVVDRNRITGAGVSAGLDLGYVILALLRDQRYAETVQLMAEYAPQPPFGAGSPDTAPPSTKTMVEAMFTDFRAGVQQTLPR